MATGAIFPRARPRAGMYEAFFLRAYSPVEPLGVWIRHTVHKAPGEEARGSVWCTVFDAARPAPLMFKRGDLRPSVPEGGWIALGEQARMGPSGAEGGCGDARWSLRLACEEPELRHLSPASLYRAPLPRTKLTTPAPAARVDGLLELAGRDQLELAGWPGMVGHNWGTQHAERWMWIHASGFREAPDAWLEVALGRIRIGGRTTPWVANGALSLDGTRYRLGGLRARGLGVAETVEGCSLLLPGEHGGHLRARVEVPPGTAAAWRYADPDGSEHDVVNCSIARVELTVELPGSSAPLTLSSAHGGAYELGMRERDHGVPIAPFADG